MVTISAAVLIAGLLPFTLGAGSLFLVLLHSLTGSRWGTVLRRRLEQNTYALEVGLLLIGLGLLLGFVGGEPLYSWVDATEQTHHTGKKLGYLNTLFFWARSLVYGLGILWLARHVRRVSQQGDQSRKAGAEALVRLKAFAPIGMIAFAFILNFAAFDWIKSLNPSWFSSIYGVYVFAGAVVVALAWLALQMTGPGWSLPSTVEHQHDVGKLLFGFNFFWGYIAFSQYLLIWYANLPVETSWYFERQGGVGTLYNVALIFGHFAFPFLGLVPRAAKRTQLLRFWAGWMVAMHAVDLVHLVMPSLHSVNPWLGAGLGCLGAGLGLMLGAWWVRRRAEGQRSVADQDPFFKVSLHLESLP